MRVSHGPLKAKLKLAFNDWHTKKCFYPKQYILKHLQLFKTLQLNFLNKQFKQLVFFRRRDGRADSSNTSNVSKFHIDNWMINGLQHKKIFQNRFSELSDHQTWKPNTLHLKPTKTVITFKNKKKLNEKLEKFRFLPYSHPNKGFGHVKSQNLI